ncbi:MAG: DUF4339 domain-containing protein [Hyphomicrobiales bacterium]|nr:DUF4339 domain-containing protein [Hyphomicrobiales bacterium]
MQESGVEAQDAERHGADWYLSRNGEQIGPLTDRELSLFAEGGNFKPGDLLWTAGLDGWTPPDAIFGLSGDSENTEEEAAPGEDAVFTVDTEDEPGDVSAGDLSEIEGGFRADADKDAAAGHEAVDLGAAHLGAKHLGAAHLDAEHLDGHDQHLVV